MFVSDVNEQLARPLVAASFRRCLRPPLIIIYAPISGVCHQKNPPPRPHIDTDFIAFIGLIIPSGLPLRPIITDGALLQGKGRRVWLFPPLFFFINSLPRLFGPVTAVSNATRASEQQPSF